MDTDAKIMTSLGGFIALLLGWLHLGTRDAKKIAESVSKELSQKYMPADKIEHLIEKVVLKFEKMHHDSNTAIRDDIREVKDDVKMLIKREIDKQK